MTPLYENLHQLVADLLMTYVAAGGNLPLRPVLHAVSGFAHVRALP